MFIIQALSCLSQLAAVLFLNVSECEKFFFGLLVHLIATQLFTLQAVNSWTGVMLWIILMFNSCLDSHSDGTHSLQRIHWWASEVMLNLFLLQWRK